MITQQERYSAGVRFGNILEKKQRRKKAEPGPSVLCKKTPPEHKVPVLPATTRLPAITGGTARRVVGTTRPHVRLSAVT